MQNKANHLYKTKQNINTKQTKTSIQNKNIAKHLYMYKINSYMNS